MKKILVVGLVSLMTASLFAGVKTSGYVQGAATSVFPMKDTMDKAVVLNKDSDNKAQVKIASESGVWTSTITVASEKLQTKTSVNVNKALQLDSKFGVSADLITWDKITGLRAYSNIADNSYDRLRTDSDGEGAALNVAYDKYVKALVGVQAYHDSIAKDNRKDSMTLIASAMVTPVDGVKASATYRMVDFDADNKATGYAVAASADIAKLAKLDGIALGAGVSYKETEGSQKKWDESTTEDAFIVANVYGGAKNVTAYAEIGFEGLEDYLAVGATGKVGKYDLVGRVNLYDISDIDMDKNVEVIGEVTTKLADKVSFFTQVKYGHSNKNKRCEVAVEPRIKVTF